MARPGSKNPDYDENLFPDERSPMMHERYSARQERSQGRGFASYAEERGFHDRRKEGRRHTPMQGYSSVTLTARDRQQLADERYHELPAEDRYEGEELHPEEGYEAEPSGENYPEKKR